MISTFRKTLLGVGAAALLCVSSTVSAQQANTANITFNLRFKVEGNIAAIDTGADVVCRVFFYKPGGKLVESRGRMTFLQAGETFVPQTADGFVDGQITLKNASLGLDVDNTRGSEDMTWHCLAVHNSGGAGPDQGFLNFGVEAVRPAYVGTCSEVVGGLNLDGEITETDVACAIQ
ncbi:hypothetical protein MACH17_12100 [Phaeobacter inhibens]|uniref:hypothetical protein n=1 Tax=Phaeobacter inhibens TaxID=221822 RepID=UPI00276181A9|nr:hypothetical protein [Phaeobacter inhibens]GLO69693.1 hypothetical protein MACH17_12100 [Phaeobacter inhibens]